MIDKHFLGLISVFLGFVAYVPYFYSIWRKRTRPHIFSWFVWGMVDGMATAAQFAAGAGAGAWAGAATTFFDITIVFLSWRMGGERNITRSDRVAFVSALAGIVLWRLTSDPVWAVLLATLVSYFAAWPTLRKSYSNPDQEAATTYLICVLRAFFVCGAMESRSFTTLFYILAVMAENILIAGLLLYRRAVLAGPK